MNTLTTNNNLFGRKKANEQKMRFITYLVYLCFFTSLFLLPSISKSQTTLCSGSTLNLNCGAGTCPSPYPVVHTVASIAGRDNNYSVFIGGNLTITGGVELEGKGFVYGNFNYNPSSTTNYNTGFVGVGSGVVPDANTDWLTIGGNLNFNGLYLIAGGASTIAGNGNVRIKGTYNSNDFYPGNGTPIADPSLNLAPFDACFTTVNTNSQCWKAATTSTNSTYSSSFGTFTFGSTNGATGLYVFNVTTDMNAGYAGTVNLSNIPSTATVLINVDKPGSADNITLNIGSFTYNGSSSFPMAMTQRILWNFPDAATVTITGGAEFMGAIVLPSRTSTLNINTSGTSGRIIAGGNVNQQAIGSEFHNYSFQGDLSPIPCGSSCTVTAPVVAAAQTICTGGNPAAFTVTTPATGNGTLSYQWQSSTTNCTSGFSNIISATNSTYDPPSGLTETTYYRLIATNTYNGNTCLDTSNCITVTVNTPSAPTVTNGSRCGTGTVGLSASACAGGTLNWYAASTGGMSLGTGTSYTTPSMSSTTTYYVDCTVSGCTSARTAVTATVNAIPIVGISKSNDLSCPTPTATLTASPSTGVSYFWDNGSTSATRVVSAAGTYSVTVTNIINGCSASANITVTSTISLPPCVPTTVQKTK